jgi:ribosomal protein S18 acetylase RimI-like enzyme
VNGEPGVAADPAAVLDEIAANAIPAATVWHLDGWVLRHTPEVPMRRANSVLTLAAGTALDLDERLAIAERLYRDAGRPPRLAVGPHSAPDGLDDALAARDYAVEAPVDVCVATTAAVLATGHALPAAVPAAGFDGATVERHPFPDERWLAAWRDCDTSDRPVELYGDAYRALLRRVGPEVLALAIPGIGVALGVRERGWVGVFSMKTHPAHRRRGVAQALLRDLARWGEEGGADRMYLQVETDNDAARGLYERSGFTRHHGYWYRTAPGHPDAEPEAPKLGA